MKAMIHTGDTRVIDVIGYEPGALGGFYLVDVPEGVPVVAGWHYIDGKWLDEAQAPQIISTMTLAEVKVVKWAEITAKCDAALAPLATEYGVYERATWDQQLREAGLVTADKALAADVVEGATDVIPLIRRMATLRTSLGDTVEERILTLAGRIMANAAAWLLVAGDAIGQGQKLWDQVDAATTVEGVQAVEVVYTLPQI